MTTRLNHDIRMAILNNAMAAQFDPQAKALSTTECELAKRVYEACTTPKERELLAALKDVARSVRWVFYPDTINVATVQGHHIFLQTDGSVPEPQSTSGRYVLTTKHAALSAEVQLVADQRQKLRADRHNAAVALSTALKRVNTLEKLFEQWPEGRAFYASPPLKKPLSLPVVRFAEVNQLLGLTVNKGEA